MKVIKSLKIAAVALAASAVTLSASAQDNTLLGAGSTFVYPLFSKIFAEYGAKTKVQVNYQSIGSGGGILQLTNKTVDFGDSDAPLNDEQAKKMGAPVLHIPMTSGATVITYNIPGITKPLNFNGKIIADIYLGKITNWNNAEIKSLNRGVNLPDLPIVVIHRSDGSGTTFIFTDYLSKVSPEWASKVGKATAVNWPAGLGGKGSEGVAGLVKQTPGGFGYVELAYAVQNKMAYGNVQNKKGKLITPTISSTSAASNVELPADSKVSLTDTDNPQGYPISGFTWALIYKEQKYNGRSAGKAKEVLKLLWYNVHEGQKNCAPLNYAPLSKSALKVAENILKSATYDGKPIL
ncbi:MAG: phosphate ABC transporter substrate-binding protein PstS [Mucilaginibacter sp.]|uniref:phosphate ABC transporter substrate-binding protein PstS n=1 Tax=Mucilaginibacter sp. L3T2-6 TaxID=3062491 RepID=UPI002675CBF0|nr:phosphate ABC transporter substrate-binding protein PstS [Mucilaginibacter sp. L3T2-6]MDO3644697.1 phosphate ABC transporter substrate-binding protein PstS [Mucilaginibacter sp. L3T2-6]MDV6217149.1 phosphate ABC transporter substrate-binding protein PstS [Mucilaginibacter sp. L3T2-6]